MYHGDFTPKMIGGVASFNDELMGMPQIKEVEIVKPDFSYKKVGTRRLTIHFDDKIQVPQV